MEQMKIMSYVYENKEMDATELRKFKICAAFGAALLYLFLVVNAKAQDIRSGAIGLHPTAAQVAR